MRHEIGQGCLQLVQIAVPVAAAVIAFRAVAGFLKSCCGRAMFIDDLTLMLAGACAVAAGMFAVGFVSQFTRR